LFRPQGQFHAKNLTGMTLGDTVCGIKGVDALPCLCA
jgi:hypothetical protein